MKESVNQHSIKIDHIKQFVIAQIKIIMSNSPIHLYHLCLLSGLDSPEIKNYTLILNMCIVLWQRKNYLQFFSGQEMRWSNVYSCDMSQRRILQLGCLCTPLGSNLTCSWCCWKKLLKLRILIHLFWTFWQLFGINFRSLGPIWGLNLSWSKIFFSQYKNHGLNRVQVNHVRIR